MRLGETEEDYYRLGAMLAAANQADAELRRRPAPTGR